MQRVQTESLSLKISIAGIDGKIVDIPLQLGVTHPQPLHYPLREDNSVLMDAILSINFRPPDLLTSIASNYLSEFDRHKAFLTITVNVSTVPVLLATRELPPDPSILPAPETRATLQQQKAEWDASAACRDLMVTLQGLADAGRLPHVDKVVAFACHRPSIAERAQRVATEHALVLSIRDFFARRDPATTVRCCAQDSLYEDVDREVLAELGMTVLDNPRSFLEVDESTVVYSLAPEVAVRQIVADITRPALMIWDRVCEIQREGMGWVGRAEQ